jgi:hypothetical protein
MEDSLHKSFCTTLASRLSSGTPISDTRAVSMLCASSAGSPHDNQISCFFWPTRSACTNRTHLAEKLREIV